MFTHRNRKGFNHKCFFTIIYWSRHNVLILYNVTAPLVIFCLKVYISAPVALPKKAWFTLIGQLDSQKWWRFNPVAESLFDSVPNKGLNILCDL